MKSKKTLVLFLILCFLTILIIIGSVLFSVKTIVGYCYNDNDPDLVQQVIDASSSELSTGTNIFLVNENDIIKKIESDVINVKVVNIERKFPSSVYINFYKIEEYFVVEHGGGYLYVSNDCKILRQSDNLTSERRIKLLIPEVLEGVAPGDTLFSTQSQLYTITNALMNALSRLEDYQNMLEIIDRIDLRFLDQNVLFIKTVAGVCIEAQQPGTDILSKMQLAISFVNNADFEQKSKGTIILSGSGNKINSSYSEEDRYSDFLINTT